MTPPVALTIAGSDSGGGAGIQADLATFAALGVHGTSAISALTAQNTAAVTQVHVPPVAFFEAQLDAVLSDLPVAAVKTGMLATAKVVRAVARRAASGALPQLVVDPVLVASSGDRLLDADAEQTYVSDLFPHALVITPNLWEAGVLLDRTLTTLDDMREAAKRLGEYGPRWVVVKGGHHDDKDAVDVVYNAARQEWIELRAPRIVTNNNHGTGCTFAAATAAMLARGAAVPEALQAAKSYVAAALRASADWRLGAGHGPVSHLAPREPA